MLLTLRKNAQITLPAAIKKAARLEDGDLLDCDIRDGQIILTPKKIIDTRDAWFWTPDWQQAEAEAQHDIDSGNVSEFETIEALLAHLKDE
ncbi:MAG: AbrB/MazE/SpoVT family DNA-binding domain-containing protein [Armatimonadota bacterium]